MKQKINLKNKYYTISIFNERDSSFSLLSEQENLVGINILNPKIKPKLEWYLSTIEFQQDKDIQKIISSISNYFYGDKRNFNVVVESDLNLSLIICAIIEISMENKQYDSETYSRVSKLLEYFYVYKNEEWREYPIPSKDNPWKIINKESSKKFEIIEDFLYSDSLTMQDKIHHILNFIQNNMLPNDSIKRVEKNKFKLIELLDTKQLEVNYTLVPKISLVKCKFNVGQDKAFDLGYLLCPIVMYQFFETDNKSNESNNFSKIYIQDRKDFIIEKEELLKDLNKLYSYNKVNSIVKNKYGNIFLDKIDNSKIKIEHILLTLAKYIKNENP